MAQLQLVTYCIWGMTALATQMLSLLSARSFHFVVKFIPYAHIPFRNTGNLIGPEAVIVQHHLDSQHRQEPCGGDDTTPSLVSH